jgi:hypothetical protein
MARRRKNQRRRPSKGPTAPSNLHRVTAPKARLKGLFKVMGDVTASADKALLSTRDVESQLGRFDVGIFVRAINAVKSVRLLLEQAHWEFAAAAVRQLFELVVNMEYLAGQPDREEATFRYAKYGLLQMVRHEHQTATYNLKTGRPVDAERLATLQSLLAHSFPEFRKKDKPDGSANWATSWCDRTTRALVESSTDGLRKDQYQLLFSTWSEQTHASPGALLDNFFSTGNEGWMEDAIASDDARIGEIGTMAVILFLQLWKLLPKGPTLDAAQAEQWISTLAAYGQQYGVPTPTPPDEESGAM